MKRIVQYSGGVGSWAAAKRVVERYGTDDLVLLFADVKDEHPDLYRFLEEGARDIGVPVTYISEGRTPREVMRDERLIGNSMRDPCSKILKRQLLHRWKKENCSPNTTVLYIGIDWTEEHRFHTFAERSKPFISEAPLLWEPMLDKEQAKAMCAAAGIELPLLYRQGFAHNNCGGACIKAGQASWARLLHYYPELYASWEAWETEMRSLVGDHSILRDRSKAAASRGTQVLTLAEFRARIAAGKRFDVHEEGGCGCAI